MYTSHNNYNTSKEKLTKRQRVVCPKPVTMLHLWRKIEQKRFAADTAHNVVSPMPMASPTVHGLLPCLLGNNNNSDYNDDNNNSNADDDAWLQLCPGNVFELAGEGGAGKTQLALSLCQRAAVEDSVKGPVALYLSLGAGRHPKALQRLQQMDDSWRSQNNNYNYNNNNSSSWLAKILTKPLLQRDDWTDFLRDADAFFGLHHTLRLVVVDSLADLVRDDFGLVTQFDRTTWLLAWVQRVKVLAERYQLAWLFVNQQATTVSAAGVWESKPALGLAWAHAVHGSWICHRAAGASSSSSGQGQHRRLVLHKSNRFVVGQTAWFVIQQDGVKRVAKPGSDRPTTTATNAKISS